MPLCSFPAAHLASRLQAPLLVLALVGLAGCTPEVEEAEAASDQPLGQIVAAVLSVDRSSWPSVVRSQGSLVADEESVVGSRVAGRVAQVHVDLGDKVAVGDPLVTLDQTEFELAVRQAEAQLAQTRSAVGLHSSEPVDQLDPKNAPPVRQERAVWEEAKANLERAERLLAQQGVSQGEYDQAAAAERVAEARLAAALNGVYEKIALIGVREAELQLARQRLEDAVIRAPLDGYVRMRNVAPGTYLSVGQSIAVVVRTSTLRFQGTVPERYAQQLRVGLPVQMQIESVAEPRTAVVSRVSPALDPQSRALAFEAEIDNPQGELRSGLFVEAEVVVDPSAEALVIPHSALVEFAGVQKVWKVVDGVATEQQVLCGTRRPAGCEVIDGLAAGDQILRDGSTGRHAIVIAENVAEAPAESATDAQSLAGEQPAAPQDKTDIAKRG